MLSKLIFISITMVATSLAGARIKAQDASFKSLVHSVQAVGVLCCDEGVLNEEAVSGGKICSSSRVMGNYPKDFGNITVMNQCDGGRFSIKMLSSDDFEDSLISGTCTETICTFN